MNGLDVESIPAALRATSDPALACIEDAGLTASQPREQAFYDGWLLRYANGKAKRARSVNLLAAGERPLDEKLAHCVAFYARRGLPFMLRVTPFSRPAGIDAALAARGFAAVEDTRVMVAPLVGRVGAPAPAGVLVALDRAEFGATLAALHGLDAARAAVEGGRFAQSVADGVYFAVRDDERAVACGCALLDGPLVGIYGLVTAPTHRGRGMASSIVAELLRRAHARGCTTAYLQVDGGNTAARRTYAKFGFADRYAYWYRTPREGTTS